MPDEVEGARDWGGHCEGEGEGEVDEGEQVDEREQGHATGG